MGQNAIYYKGKSYTGGGGGGGSSTLINLTDVNINNPTEGQGLVYDATNQEWVNADVGGGSGYEETVLLDNQTTVTSGSTLSLNDDYTKYDIIIIDASTSEYIDWRDFVVIDVSQIVLNEEHSRVLLRTSNALYGLRYKFTGATDIYAYGDGDRGIIIYKIVGIKFGGGGGGGSSETSYSTEEQRIGTWIDGKPLYQKTFDMRTTTLTDNAWNNNILGTVGTGIKIREFDGKFGLNGYGDLFADYSYFRSTSEYFTATLISANDDIAVRPNMNAGVSVMAGIVTIKYTKTTD